MRMYKIHKNEKSFTYLDLAFQHRGHARSSPLHRAKINPTKYNFRKQNKLGAYNPPLMTPLPPVSKTTIFNQYKNEGTDPKVKQK